MPPFLPSLTPQPCSRCLAVRRPRHRLQPSPPLSACRRSASTATTNRAWLASPGEGRTASVGARAGADRRTGSLATATMVFHRHRAPTANRAVLESDLYSAYRHAVPNFSPARRCCRRSADQVRADLPEWHWHGVGQGASVMEVSHRGKKRSGADWRRPNRELRDLLSIPANHRVIFVQGGAWGSSRRCR